MGPEWRFFAGAVDAIDAHTRQPYLYGHCSGRFASPPLLPSLPTFKETLFIIEDRVGCSVTKDNLQTDSSLLIWRLYLSNALYEGAIVNEGGRG